jgi:hypothetical protein
MRFSRYLFKCLLQYKVKAWCPNLGGGCLPAAIDAPVAWGTGWPENVNERSNIMRILLNRFAGRRAFGSGVPITTTLLLLATVGARADTAYTATGWVTDVPLLPIMCINAAGQVLMRGNAHTARVSGSDARMTGNRLIFANGGYQADGSALIYGTAYQQVGTFDANTNFTPTAGLWEISYSGVMQTNYSLQVNLVGCGSGGAIEGQRIVETMTRGPASGPIDPAVPYLYTGTIKPAPANTTQVADDFNHTFNGSVYGSGTCFNSNGQFYAVGNFQVPTRSVDDSYVFGGFSTIWSVPNGQTREWRADLVSLDENATNTAILAVGPASTAPGYAFHKGRDFAYLLKWSSSFGMSVLWCDRPALPLPNTNVVMALALTREQPNLILTARVLDKADPNTVLFQHSVVDTPGSDPTLTVAQFQALTGIRFLDLVADSAEAPITSAWVVLGVFQNTDGHQPVPKAIWDNLELRTSEIPFLGIERAVRVSWPASATINYAVEGAPTVQGPWLPVQNSTIPGMNQITVPASGFMRFFRPVQAP